MALLIYDMRDLDQLISYRIGISPFISHFSDIQTMSAVVRLISEDLSLE